MIHVLFICHGNICRSPMAEFVFNDMARKLGLAGKIRADSAAVSTEEIGNPVHPGTRKKLRELGISCEGKTARQMTASDYGRYDLLVGMDRQNLRGTHRIAGKDPAGKVRLLLDFAPPGTGDASGEVADPWYTGDFDSTLRDVLAGCRGILRHFFPKEAVQ